MSGTVKCFEDLQAWQCARILVREIYTLTNAAAFYKDIALREQIRRAAISVMLNIAEGFGRRTDKEFRHFLIQAHGSATEIQSALYIALDQAYIAQADFDSLYAATEKLSKMIMNLAKYLDKPKTKS